MKINVAIENGWKYYKNYWKKEGSWNLQIHGGKCIICGDDFLCNKYRKTDVCSVGCSNTKSFTGEKNGMYGRKHTEESKRSMRINTNNHGKNNGRWKGGVTKDGIPLYDTYAHQIEWCEKVRRNEEDPIIMEVKCTYCGKWHISKRTSIENRIRAINKDIGRECRLYCSDGCKTECPVFNKKSTSLIKEDALRAGRLDLSELNRETQPELRQMVFERDNWTCVKCNTRGGNLHCHHREGIRWDPLQSADVDMCITVCKNCHKKIHKIPGCGYHEMRCDKDKEI